MNTLSFHFLVRVKISLTPAEIAHLLTISSQHYDGKCKAISQEGGFLRGIENLRLWNPNPATDPVECFLTRDEVDTLCKITEMEQVYVGKHILYGPMRDILRKMREESDRVNTLSELDTITVARQITKINTNDVGGFW